jgi:class 3 adenylate cyclase/pimeloyl-ACP methyl ester carboxylesterase
MERRLSAVMATDMVGFSRLMEADEMGVLARQKTHRKELIDPAIAAAGGTIIKQTGDGLIVEFPGAQDAVRCGIEIQKGMRSRESANTRKTRIEFRIGINVGDIIFDDGDIFGDGVNVAARLEALAEPGGVSVSDPVYQMTQAQVGDRFSDLGVQKVKNISRPIRVWQWTPDGKDSEPASSEKPLSQQISFCFSGDGTQLAWAQAGQGTPVLKAPNWLNHLEYEWRSPIWGQLFREMSGFCKLVRFDQRGNGLSDWEPAEISERAMISDMDDVAKSAGFEKFFLFGLSQGCAFSVRYAVEHPEKVAGLILVGGYARGACRRDSEAQTAIHTATNTLIREGWGAPNPAFRNLFTQSMMPDATAEQQSSFDELQRVATSPAMAAQLNDMNADVDVSALAQQIQVPTLVMHAGGDKRVPVEEGRRLAALIPSARFVGLPGNNHALVDDSEALEVSLDETRKFVAEHRLN